MTYIKIKNTSYGVKFAHTVNKHKIDIKLLTRMFNIIVEFKSSVFIKNDNFTLEIRQSFFTTSIGISNEVGFFRICIYSVNDHLIRLYNDKLSSQSLLYQEKYVNK